MEKLKKRVASDWENLLSEIKGKHAKRMNSVLETLPEEEFIVLYPKLLEFAVPKMTRTEVVNDAEEQVIRVVHVDAGFQFPEIKE